MTQNELLDRIAQEGLKPYGNVMNTNLVLALRAVVELHIPDSGTPGEDVVCDYCKTIYPCPTIRAIEKELG